jgi:hypothetical protein
MGLGFPLLVLCLAASPDGARQRVHEEILVREVELVLDLRDTLENDRLSPEDFVVLVGGETRRVTRVESVAESPAPWTLLVYVDETLAGPETVFAATLALAQRSATLAALGSVEVVTAGSAGRRARVVLPPSREPLKVEEVLAQVAGEARVARDRAAQNVGRPSEPPGYEERFDLLLETLADRRSAGPHALLLVIDGLDLAATDLEFLEGASLAEPPTDHPAAPFRALARLLAAEGWVTVAVPLRKQATLLSLAGLTDAQVFRQHMDVGFHNGAGPPPVTQFASRTNSLQYAEVIDFTIAPQTAVLRALVRPTAGMVVGYDVQLDSILGALGRRVRLWLGAPEADGSIQPVTVRYSRRATDIPVRSAAWLRSGTPEEIAEVRLRRLFADQSETAGELPFTASAVPTGSGARIDVHATGLSGRLRVSVAFRRKDGSVTVRHEIVSAPAGAWEYTTELSLPPTAVDLAVLVEELGTGRWRARRLPPLSDRPLR